MSSTVLVWGGQGKQSEAGSVMDGMWPAEMRQDALTNRRKEHVS